MINYIVEIELNGDIQAHKTEAVNPGSAFFKVLRDHPGATLIRCTTAGRMAGHNFLPVLYLTYDAPKNQDMPKHIEKENATQSLMPWA